MANKFENLEKFRAMSLGEDEKKYPEELKPVVREAQDFIISHKGFFDMIGGSPADPPEYVLDDNLERPNYWYAHKENKIGISLKGFADLKKGGLTKPQILFAVGHELGHFSDMREDPAAYAGNFEECREKAIKLAPEAMAIWQKRGVNLPDWVTPEIVAEQFLSEQYRDMYNALDDIYVNRHNARALPRFKGEYNGFNKEVRDVYAGYFFKKEDEKGKEQKVADYLKLPRTKQMLYYLLRRYMVPDEEVMITEEVRGKLEDYLSQADKRHGNSIQKAIYEITRPTSEYEKNQHKAGVRYDWIERWIEPIFKEFLLKDLADMPLPKFNEQKKGQGGEGEQGKEQAGGKNDGKKGSEGEGKGQEGEEDKDTGKESKGGREKGKEGKDKGKEGEEGKGEGKEGEKAEGQPGVWRPASSPRPFTKEDVERYIKAEKERKVKEKKEGKMQEKEAAQTPAERIKSKQRQADYKIAAEAGLDKQAVELYETILKDIEPHKVRLAETFKQLMENIEERLVLAWESGWRKGKFNIDHFIEKYGALLAGDKVEAIPWERLDVYDRREFTKKLSLFPNKIRLRLIIDGSGSMADGNKRLEAMRLSVLMMEALKVFESEMNHKFRLKEEFYVDTEISVFGSSGASAVVKPFDSLNPQADKQIARWRAVRELGVNRGSTIDDEAWARVDESVDYEEDLKRDKAMEFCFEITDGGADTDEVARSTGRFIDRLENKGVNVMGFLVGGKGSNDLRKFNIAWNDSRSGRTVNLKRGFEIEDPSQLSEIIAKRFTEIIRNKRIKISAEGEMDEE